MSSQNSEIKDLVSSMSRKWKLKQIPSKKLDIENKLMEERLNQLRNEHAHDKDKRSAQGGTLWSGAHPGPINNYAKSLSKPGESLSAKLTNRQIKLKVLKDEAIATRVDKQQLMALSGGGSGGKKNKCGQCEKNTAFTRCLECGEDYCANCFTEFHMKGALQKHRALPISNDGNLLPMTQSQSLSTATNNRSAAVALASATSSASSTNSKQRKLTYEPVGENENDNDDDDDDDDNDDDDQYVDEYDEKVKAPAVGNAASARNTLLTGTYDERAAHESFQQAVAQWRSGAASTSGDPEGATAKKMTKQRPPQQKQQQQQQQNRNVAAPKHVVKSRDMVTGTGDDRDSGSTPVGSSSSSSAATVQHLEEVINTSHALSYAERMLLQKYRRSDLDLDGGAAGSGGAATATAAAAETNRPSPALLSSATPDSRRTQQTSSSSSDSDKELRNTIIEANSQHINFETIMEALNDNDNNSSRRGVIMNKNNNNNITNNNSSKHRSSIVSNVKSNTGGSTHTLNNEPGEFIIIEEVAVHASRSNGSSSSTARKSAAASVSIEHFVQLTSRRLSPELIEPSQAGTNKNSVEYDRDEHQRWPEQRFSSAATQRNERPALSRSKTDIAALTYQFGSSVAQTASSKRINTAKQQLQQQKRCFESNLSSAPSDLLRAVTKRGHSEDGAAVTGAASAVGQFLMLDVNSSSNEQHVGATATTTAGAFATPKATTTPRGETPIKLSNKFYSMTPRSWHPQNSICSEQLPATTTTTTATAVPRTTEAHTAKQSGVETKTEDAEATSSALNTMKSGGLKSAFRVPPKSEQSASRHGSGVVAVVSQSSTKPTPALPPTPARRSAVEQKASTNGVEAPISAKVIAERRSVNTKVRPRPTAVVAASATADLPSRTANMSLERPKSYVSSIKKTPPGRKSEASLFNLRAASATGSYASANKDNLEVSTQFLTYDVDDGRSSRLLQNEDDDKYYGQLESELRTSFATSRRDQIEAVEKMQQSEPVNKNQAKNIDIQALSMNAAELTLGNEEFDVAMLDEEDLEELRSLR